jgi:alpha-tubulin suppressor-like RCC1 family protein
MLGAEAPPFQFQSTALRAAGTLMFRDLSASTYLSCGAATTGGVYCWGLYGGNSSAAQLQPGTESLTSIGVSSAVYMCALDANGVSCWGSNYALGHGPIAGGIAFPTHIAGSESFERISVGAYATCALTRDGEAFCWGANRSGVLGNGSRTDTPTPTLVADPVT